MQPTSLPDITGASAAAQFSTVPLRASWVQVVCPSGNAANVRIGGPEVSATRGLPLPPGWSGQLMPVQGADKFNNYDLSTIYYYATTGDKLYVLYGG
jgi:hypothetical protein